MPATWMQGVTEYQEGFPVQLESAAGREVLAATLQGGRFTVQIDLLQALAWLKANRPELLE